MSAPLCSCDTYGNSGLKNTCSQAGEMMRKINALTRENAQLKAVIAEQKDSLEYWIANSATLSQERLAQDIVIEAQKEMIEELTKENRIERNLRIGVESSFDCFNEEIGRLKATIDTCDELSRLAKIKRDEQSALIEMLGEAVRVSCFYVVFFNDMTEEPISKKASSNALTILHKALAELAAWREK